jgi:hypothetical protein
MENNNTTQSQPAPEKIPNDTGTVSFESFLKISDPKTRKIFVEQKA